MIPMTTWWIALAAFIAVMVYGLWRSARTKDASNAKDKRKTQDGGGYADPVSGGAGTADGGGRRSDRHDSGDSGSDGGGGDGGGGGGGD